MNRRRWLLAAALPVVAIGGYFGYRALQSLLIAAMTSRMKEPTAAGVLPAAQATAAPQMTPSHDVSGLDLIVKSASSPSTPNAARSAAQIAAIRQAGVGLVSSLKPMLQDPSFTSRLSPAQARQYARLMGLLGQAEEAAKSDRPLDLRRMAATVREAQELSLGLMSQASQAAPAKTPGQNQ